MSEEQEQQQQNSEANLGDTAKQFEENYQQSENATNLNGGDVESTVTAENATNLNGGDENVEQTVESKDTKQNTNYKKQSPTWIESKEKQIEQEQSKTNPDNEYVNELKSQLQDLKAEIQENIIEKYEVPDELREFLPKDTKNLKSFLNSDKYKKLKEGVQMVNQRNQPKEDAPQPDGPPTKHQQKQKPTPKTFEELTSDDFSAFDDLFL